MSQTPSSSQALATTSNFLKHAQYKQACLTVLNLGKVVGSAAEKAATRDWVEEYEANLVRSGFFSFSRLLTSFQQKLRLLGPPLSLDPSSDSELCKLGEAARTALLPFTTSDWVNLVPSIVTGLEGLVTGLKSRVVLGDSFSDFAPQ